MDWKKLTKKAPTTRNYGRERKRTSPNRSKTTLTLLGVVPLDEHLALVRKYEELKEKVASQEETIKHLRLLFAEGKKEEFQEVSGRFEELAKKQGEQLQKLMESFAQSPKKTDSSQA